MKGNGRIDRLTESVLASYRRDRRTQRIGSPFLPSRDAIVGILGDLRQLLFPGFFGELAVTSQNIRYHAGELIIRLRRGLADQIYHCLCYDPSLERPRAPRPPLLQRRRRRRSERCARP